MIWTLIIVFAFSIGPGVRYGGAGGLTSETIDFSTKEECEAIGKEITDFYKTDGGQKQVLTQGWGRQYYEYVRNDPAKDWMAENLKIQYKCVQHTIPNKN